MSAKCHKPALIRPLQRTKPGQPLSRALSKELAAASYLNERVKPGAKQSLRC
jgi:hypothetical protein